VLGHGAVLAFGWMQPLCKLLFAMLYEHGSARAFGCGCLSDICVLDEAEAIELSGHHNCVSWMPGMAGM
jgi:hypothetical protein